MVCSFSFFVHPLSPAAKMYRIFRSSSFSFWMTSMIHLMSTSLFTPISTFFFGRLPCFFLCGVLFSAYTHLRLDSS